MNIVARPWKPQDLIDDLQLLIDEEPDNYLNFRRTTMCMARDYLKEHFAEPRWISVEERLPDKDKDVMCYSDKNGGYMFFGYRGWISGEWMEGGSLHIGDVTHWMPLPEPPEVEEGAAK